MDIYEQGVLIVDDEEVIRNVVSEILNQFRFKKIYTASSGIQCIDMLKELGEDIAVILIDIRMPEMDGIDTVQHIMNYHEGVVGVIFHTAFPEFKPSLSSLGNEHVLNLDYIEKGQDISKIVSSITNCIKIVLEKRKNLISKNETNIIKGINYLKDDIFSVKSSIKKHVIGKIVNQENRISAKISEQEKRIVDRIDKIEKKMNLISTELDNLNKKIPSFWVDVGKQILIIIILAVFVLCFLSSGIPDLIKKIIP